MRISATWAIASLTLLLAGTGAANAQAPVGPPSPDERFCTPWIEGTVESHPPALLGPISDARPIPLEGENRPGIASGPETVTQFSVPASPSPARQDSMPICQANGQPCKECPACLPPAQRDWTAIDASHWTFAADALMLQRAGLAGQSLLLAGTGNQSAEIVDARDLNFNVAGGPRLTAVRHDCYGWDLELSYFQIDGCDARRFTAGPAWLVADRLGGSRAVADSQIDYTSRLYNVEVNASRPFDERVNFLVGFRTIGLDDHYRFDGFEAGGLHALLANNAENRLYGFQIGVDARLFDFGPVRIDAAWKGGIFGNSVRQNSTLVDQAGAGPALGVRSTQGRAALSSEVSLTGLYQVTERLAVRAGYELLWLDGIALASSQVGDNDLGAGVAASLAPETFFAHGATIGMELAY